MGFFIFSKNFVEGVAMREKSLLLYKILCFNFYFSNFTCRGSNLLEKTLIRHQRIKMKIHLRIEVPDLKDMIIRGLGNRGKVWCICKLVDSVNNNNYSDNHHPFRHFNGMVTYYRSFTNLFHFINGPLTDHSLYYRNFGI